ncbi:Spore coat protein SA [Polaribacter huanghezhanensis]|uniref:glycosyltransferase family 4 protein n=1 Tax=Polaribacter huanghezhanensis TaxID=1354726 RepID=UPI0026471900|nr:glycosyltransferase family 4 protein [Polaribacter huanghezhanensis]WKD86509.1 Spore coat protein SA [Polaribacter huanghezhanensis]
MHICFITSEFPTEGLNGGGIGSVVKFLGEKLVKKNIAVSVVGFYTINSEQIEKVNGIHVYRLPKSQWKFARFYDHTKRILKKINEINTINTIDIVEGSELNFAFFPKKTSYKKVIRLHGGHHFFAIELNKKPAFWRAYQEKRSFKNANEFIAVSNYVGNQTKKYLKRSFNFKTIYNTVDANQFKNNNALEYQKNSLLFVGTICEKKGVRQLVQAIPIIKKQFPDVVLNIIGRDWTFPDGKSYIAYLKTFILDADKKNINIIGPVPHTEVSNYIAKTELCVYPSRMESFGLVLIESLLMEKPVLASNIKPFEEIKNNKNIFKTLESITSRKIAESIIDILSSKEESRKRGINAREDILKRFNSFKIIEENIQFYKNILT